VRNAVSLGGDTDTQAAIAGGVAEAMFGIDNKLVEQILSYLDDDMITVICDFYRKHNMPNQTIN
jgi:ADP-ribosylglycohydrolase